MKFTDEQIRTIRREGEILADKTWDEDSGHYQGCNRVQVLHWRKRYYTIEMLNGEYLSISEEFFNPIK